jgi:glutamate-1-semialdehyde aminotransferase/malonyl CoA-acyl carrier protein transacylase/acyl carrier protein
VIRGALIDAKLSPDDISYVEAHGTGTALGDPIEVEGLTRVFKDRHIDNELLIGSVKGNIGHLDNTAGVIGLIKVALSLKNKQIPGTVNFRSPNPHLQIESKFFKFSSELQDWDSFNSKKRYAGVSSFGVGGTNAHVVLEEPPVKINNVNADNNKPELIILSADTEKALNKKRIDLLNYCSQFDNSKLCDMAYTLRNGRSELKYRQFFIAYNIEDTKTKLIDLNQISKVRKASRRSPFVVFSFPGHGSQYAAFGKQLYDNEPSFRKNFKKTTLKIFEQENIDVANLLYGNNACLESTLDIHLSLFAVEYALGKTFEGWGVKPSAYIGHSLGELVAAVSSDVIDFSSAIKLLIYRAKLIEGLEEGRLLAIATGEDQLENMLSNGIEVAAINSPQQSVLAGSVDAINKLKEELDVKGIPNMLVPSKYAFHTSQMYSLREELLNFTSNFKFNLPRVPIASSVTGEWLKPEEATDPSYWIDQILKPVKFSKAIKNFSSNPGAFFLELGPGSSLCSYVKQTIKSDNFHAMPCLDSLMYDSSTKFPIYNALGALWTNGLKVQWDSINVGCSLNRTDLPTYPFEENSYWVQKNIKKTEGIELTNLKSDTVAKEVEVDSVKILPKDIIELFKETTGISLNHEALKTNMFELGLDSLILTQLAQSIRKRYKVRLKFGELMNEFPTPELLIQKVISVGELSQGVFKDKFKNTLPSLGDTTSESETSKNHGPFTGSFGKQTAKLRGEQYDYLSRFIEAYNSKTINSKSYISKHRKHFCDPRSISGFHPQWKEIVYPIVSERSKGSKIWDIDGNEYIDITMGFGSNYLGHSPQFVVDAIANQLEKGIEIGPQNLIAGEAAKKLCSLTKMDRAVFCNTGSEAVIAAMRIARAATDKSKVVLFSGSYHGISNSVLARMSGSFGSAAPVAVGIPQSAVDDIIVLPYCEEKSLQFISENSDSIAAVLVEPVQARNMQHKPADFLKDLRVITKDNEIILVFDEIVTGFRCALGGAQEYFGVAADLATYGKIIGGGMPIGALAGKSALMDYLDGGDWKFGDNSSPEQSRTFFAGTFVRHPLSMAACKSVLDFLQEDDGKVQSQLSKRVDAFCFDLTSFINDQEIPIEVTNFSSMFRLNFSDSLVYSGLLFYFLREFGVFAWEERLGHFSIAHEEEDFNFISKAFKECITKLNSNGFLVKGNLNGE